MSMQTEVLFSTIENLRSQLLATKVAQRLHWLANPLIEKLFDKNKDLNFPVKEVIHYSNTVKVVFNKAEVILSLDELEEVVLLAKELNEYHKEENMKKEWIKIEQKLEKIVGIAKEIRFVEVLP